MIDTNITRYEVNEHGELPVSYGRYVRWEDFDYFTQELLKRIDSLEDQLADAEAPCCDYDAGHEDGYQEGLAVGTRIGMQSAVDVLKKETYK